jgi:hypothetical protein
MAPLAFSAAACSVQAPVRASTSPNPALRALLGGDTGIRTPDPLLAKQVL